MTDPTPTPQAPPQGLTDEQLLELAAREIEPFPPDYEAGRGRPLEVYGCELIAFARAAIAAHEAQRMEWLKGSREIAILTAAIDGRIAATVEAARPQPTAEHIEARFRAWWAESFPNVPAGDHTVRSHVAFALHLLGGEGAA